MKFIVANTSHDEERVMVNVDQIALITYYKDSDMSRIDTVIKGMPIWVDGNLIAKMSVMCAQDEIIERAVREVE